MTGGFEASPQPEVSFSIKLAASAPEAALNPEPLNP
jgi:hypothetical protein